MSDLCSPWSSWTPLHIAAFGNDVDLTLENASHVDVNELDRNGRPPLQIAVESHNIEVISTLLKLGASFDQVVINGMKGTAVFEHPHFFDLGLQLLSSVRMPRKFLAVAASHAGYTNQPGLVETILTNGSFDGSVLNSYDCIGLTPLHYAVLGGSTEAVGLMIDHGGGTMVLSQTDLSYPIHYACAKGDVATFELLWKHSSSTGGPSILDSQDVCGRTPFHLALYNSRWEFLCSFSSLLGLCDVHLTDSNGHSVPGLLFRMRNTFSIPSHIQAAIPCLTQDEADWMLHDAISDKNEELLCYALQQRANPNCFDLMQQSPLIHAAKLGSTEMCLPLLEYGADQSTNKDFSGHTALHYSAQNGHLDVTRTLLQFPGADCFSLSVDAYMPLDKAFENGHLDVASELLQAMERCSPNSPLPHWMRSLTLAVSCASDSLLQRLARHFPRKWIKDLLLKHNNTCKGDDELPLDTAHRLVRQPMLRKYIPSQSFKKIFASDLKKRSNVREKQKRQKQADVREYEPFHQVFKFPVRKKLKPFFRKQHCEHYYPIHQALYARNKDSFLFLLKESQDAGLIEDFLSAKGIAGVTVAQLLSKMFPELIDNCNIEDEVYQCLLNVFIENEGIVFPSALLDHLMSGIH